MEKKKMSTEDESSQRPDAKAIGEQLRKKRAELNYSLKEAENATSIRINYLQSIENGELDKLISPVYAQGFFRQYASFLGIDGDAIVRENPQMFFRAETQEFSYGIGTLEVRGNPGSHVKWFPNLFWILAFGCVFVISWYAAKFFGLF